MSGVATAVVGTAVVGGYLQSQGAKSAAAAQGDAANRASAQAYWNTEAAKSFYDPYAELGKTSLASLTEKMPYFGQQFTNADLNSTLAPGYEFRLGQGQKANLQAANAAGGALSGNALRGLQDYTQNFASGEYANAFNQFQAQRSNIYNQLSDIAKIGLTATQGQANAQLGLGNTLASLTTGAGNAQAASNIAQGNAWANAAQTAGSAGAYYGLNQMNQPSNPQNYQSVMGSSGFGTSGAGNDLTGGQGFNLRT